MPLDYVSCLSEAFKRIKKGLSYYRSILLNQKPKSTITDKSKMEKRLGYFNKVTEMLNSGMIPPGNSNIMHRLILGKTRVGEEIRNWKNHNPSFLF